MTIKSLPTVALIFIFLLAFSGCVEEPKEVDNPHLKPLLDLACDGVISPWELGYYQEFFGQEALSIDSISALSEMEKVSIAQGEPEVDIYLDYTGSMLGFYNGQQKPFRVLQTILNEVSDWHIYAFRNNIQWVDPEPILNCFSGNANWKKLYSHIDKSRKNLKANKTTPLENILLSIADSCAVRNSMAIVLTDGLNCESEGMTVGDLINFNHSEDLVIRADVIKSQFQGTWYGETVQKGVDTLKQFYVISIGTKEQLYNYEKNILGVPAMKEIEIEEEGRFFSMEIIKPCFSIRPRSANTKDMTVGAKTRQECFDSYTSCYEVEGGAEILIDVAISGHLWNDHELDFENLENWTCEGKDGFEVVEVKALSKQDQSCRRDCALASHTIRLRCPETFGQENLKLTFSIKNPDNSQLTEELKEWMEPLQTLYYSSQKTDLLLLDMYISSLKD